MRVLGLTHRLPYAPNRGDRIVSYHMLRHAARQHDVELVSLVHDRDEAAHVGDLASLGIRTHVAPVSRVHGAWRSLVGMANGTALTHALLDSAKIRPILTDIVAARRPDVVLAFSSSMARFALEPPLTDIPLVHHMVDVDSAKWSQLAALASPPKRWVYAREHRALERFERLAARVAVTTLVVNERERQLLKRLAPGADVRVVENGVDLERFRATGPPAAAPIAVFCGVMNYEPNEAGAIWLARHVWPLVIAARPEAKLLLVGASPTPAIRALATATITVTGSVPDTRPFLWNAAVGLAPLQTARGIQNKVLEAVAAGLPTVVTPAAAEGLPPEISPAALVASSPETFASTIVELFSRSATERRAIAADATLDALAWDTRLAPLSGILAHATTHERSSPG